MSYLVDSDWVILALKGRPEAKTLLGGLASAGLAISLVTYGEVYEGIYYGTDSKKNEQVFLNFLRDIDTLPLTETIMKRFAQLRGHLRATGLPVGDLDLLIAATALTHSLTLVTGNVRHFYRVPDLSIYQAQ
jgi:tRNA(fMet)-specific endonuclease VapC